MIKPSGCNLAGLILFWVATALYAPAQVFTYLGLIGDVPDYMSLVQGRDGHLYGATYYGGASGDGSIFRMTIEGEIATLYNFCTQEGCGDGEWPQWGVTQAADGTLYGTTQGGGTYGSGTIFKLAPNGHLVTLHSFDDLESSSSGSLVQAVDGSLYGENGGGSGILYRITTEGKFTTVYRFCPAWPNCADGSGPVGGLIQATNGNLYGTTASGGAYNGGTVFRLSPTGKLTTLYSFCSPQTNCADGYRPFGLVQASDGTLFGITLDGGDLACVNLGLGCGTVFRITLSGDLTTLHTFCTSGNCPDGSEPQARLVQATDGNLYGTTYRGGEGGSDGAGTVFAITPAGSLATLHSFTGFDGDFPQEGLIQDTSGILYGVTSGVAAQGTSYSLDMGLGPFVTFVQAAGRVGQTGSILGQGFTGTTSVSFNGIPASFTVVSDTFLKATVPQGATTGHVTVTTPSGTLTSNVVFHVLK